MTTPTTSGSRRATRRGQNLGRPSRKRESRPGPRSDNMVAMVEVNAGQIGRNSRGNRGAERAVRGTHSSGGIRASINSGHGRVGPGEDGKQSRRGKRQTHAKHRPDQKAVEGVACHLRGRRSRAVGVSKLTAETPRLGIAMWSGKRPQRRLKSLARLVECSALLTRP